MIAFLTKFSNTDCKSPLSPYTSNFPKLGIRSSMPFFLVSSEKVSSNQTIISFNLNFSGDRESSLDSILEIVIKSENRFSSRLDWWDIFFKNFILTSLSEIAPFIKVSTKPLIAKIGVFNSWETFAIN